MSELTGRVAVVTGGGSGIGEAIARRFAAAGARVIVVGRRAATIEAVAREIGGEAVAADVAREPEIEALFAGALARHGRVDVLVNNAGITGPVSAAATLDIAAWDETIAINVRGVIVCLKHAIRAMQPRRSGAIVNMSSLMGLRGYPMRSAYVATKFAVIGITQSVAQEVGKDGIRVNALCPGAVSGELMDRVIAARARAEGRAPEEIIRTAYTDVAALRRWVEPREVADAALFLASDASASITGEHLRVDAGRM
jgi:hypothetical protein